MQVRTCKQTQRRRTGTRHSPNFWCQRATKWPVSLLQHLWPHPHLLFFCYSCLRVANVQARASLGYDHGNFLDFHFFSLDTWQRLKGIGAEGEGRGWCLICRNLILRLKLASKAYVGTAQSSLSDRQGITLVYPKSEISSKFWLLNHPCPRGKDQKSQKFTRS